jgi:5-hydroxyisourate hydrolase-like protein (transthyretin family)
MNSLNENKILVKREFIEEIFLKYEELLMLKIKNVKNNKINELKTFNENKFNDNLNNNNNDMISLYKIDYNTKNIYKNKILQNLKNSKINLKPIKIDL